MSKSAEKISDEAVEKASGKKWDEWFSEIDKHNGKDLDHKQIVNLIRSEYDVSHWWAQMITVEYERHSGRRILGQTADTGFQLGAQKTLNAPKNVVWDTILSQSGLDIWLGKDANLQMKRGFKYSTSTGIHGEVRTIADQEKLRMTWQKDDGPVTTLQLYLFESGSDKTSLRFHHEKLESQTQRDELKKYWQERLTSLAELLD